MRGNFVLKIITSLGMRGDAVKNPFFECQTSIYFILISKGDTGTHHLTAMRSSGKPGELLVRVQFCMQRDDTGSKGFQF